MQAEHEAGGSDSRRWSDGTRARPAVTLAHRRQARPPASLWIHASDFGLRPRPCDGCRGALGACSVPRDLGATGGVPRGDGVRRSHGTYSASGFPVSKSASPFRRSCFPARWCLPSCVLRCGWRRRSSRSSRSSMATPTVGNCPAARALLYSLGFVVATGLLHLVGILLGEAHRWAAGRQVVRAAGGGARAGGTVLPLAGDRMRQAMPAHRRVGGGRRDSGACPPGRDRLWCLLRRHRARRGNSLGSAGRGRTRAACWPEDTRSAMSVFALPVAWLVGGLIGARWPSRRRCRCSPPHHRSPSPAPLVVLNARVRDIGVAVCRHRGRGRLREWRDHGFR